MTAEQLTVRVTLRDDEGEELVLYASGASVDEAVRAAEEMARTMLADESFVMTEWEAA